MDRAELERLDRTALIAEAEARGVTRANILTRPELVDELLVRHAKQGDKDLPRARGFFGRARDLVAKVIEKGLHLPDAAERLRQVTVTATQIAARVAPAVVPTVTLAEIYAAQGHRSRAIETLRRVLELEPDHSAAQSLLLALESAPVTIPPAVPPPPPEPEDEADPAHEDEDARGEAAREAPASASQREAPPSWARARAAAPSAQEASSFLDDDPLPIRYDVDECVAISVDPVSLYVYWEVRQQTVAHTARLHPYGKLCLRLVVVIPSWDGPSSLTRDFDVDSPFAKRVVRDLPAGAVVRAAIGWREGESFLPLAHAPAIETPEGVPYPVAAESFVRWTPRGLAPVSTDDRDYPSIARALGRLAPHGGGSYALSTAPLGSSELSAGFTAPPPVPGNGSVSAADGAPDRPWSSESVVRQ